MVWGALSYRGFYLKILDGKATIDSQKYCQIVAEFVPYADALYEEGWILQQDGATPHTSAKTKNWLSEKKFKFCNGHRVLLIFPLLKMCGRY